MQAVATSVDVVEEIVAVAVVEDGETLVDDDRSVTRRTEKV